ncbi:hypothetical protein F9C07_1548 [Aspergillus flavus]|uniref:Uncharacterized protein n=1 Tax=Aspergillus flavus (strain ATCC 200026 / FGSC A1120 / IAM 13836 / NRRL 3357 / JCM 12722 / SRRC 167) TaxID=332952 RepID=A0A7U2MRK0_ASPFN|nr:hypothetical protein F9C07_1548 [Aspergillus flavus]
MVPDTFEGPETKDYAPPDWRPQRQTRVQLDPSDLMTVPRTLGCRENSAPRPWAEPRGESKDFDFDNALHYFALRLLSAWAPMTQTSSAVLLAWTNSLL